MQKRKLQTKKIDYTPQTTAEKTFHKKCDSIYEFLNASYVAYGRMRFRGANFMTEPPKELSAPGVESIAEHMWATQLLWQATLPILPHLVKLIDSHTVSLVITLHDLGEIGDGDISAVLQLKGHGKNRAKREKEVFAELTSLLPSESEKFFNNLHSRYEQEKNDPKTRDKEVLLTKIFDMFQGDHFVLTQGIDIALYADQHRQIVSTKLLPYAKRLITLLQEENHDKAAEEVQMLIKHHLYQYQRKKILIEFKG